MDIPQPSTSSDVSIGDSVYLFYRNPHTQNVATVQEAQVVPDPYNPGQLALFLYDTYYPLSDEFVFFKSLEDAEALYNDYFGPTYE
ncbi:transcriptional regulator of the spore photoproduct lyase operon [Bacillus tianshenii]|uniref:Transcriptional regulator of the spore photoproduct lyase operon n=1 Tax=Sutcliffiella tianshenii TaxID=1463404 RepID=A0ABS2P553_9BACI|nr:transcriptional regulator SplA domain-containing protein [Bacillus tianshenii]MBM7622092.1 transcriptional regulator of the spore photoproduct lyase operon [Bacillus tianshenii]MCA1319306.1 transcriptional regulator [Bacillus tianshenii]